MTPSVFGGHLTDGKDAAATLCRFGEHSAPATVRSARLALCVSPAASLASGGARGEVPVELSCYILPSSDASIRHSDVIV